MQTDSNHIKEVLYTFVRDVQIKIRIREHLRSSACNLKTLAALSVWEDMEHLTFSCTVDGCKTSISIYPGWTYLSSVIQRFHF